MKQHISALILCLAVGLLCAGCSAEAKKARTLDRAGKLFADGHFEQAKIEYMNLLQENPQSAIVNERLALIWMEQGAPFRALPFMVRVGELAPNNHTVRTKLAKALVAAGRIEEGRTEALAAIKAGHSEGDALLLLSETIRTLPEFDATLAELRKSPARDSAVGKVAFANLRLLKGEHDEAAKLIAAALKLDPKSSAALGALATLELTKGNRDIARQHFKAAAESAPVRSLARVKYAEFLAQSGAADEAKVYLGEMIRSTPDYLVPRQVLARLLIHEKKLPEAEAVLTELFHRDSVNIDGHILQAQIFAARGEVKKAIERLEVLQKPNPGVAVITYNLARLIAGQGDLEQAITVLRAGVGRNPDHLDSVTLLAELFLRTGKPDVAVQGLAHLLGKFPQYLPAQSQLVTGLRALGRLEDAIGVARELARALPRSPEPQLLLGSILLQQGKPAEARQCLETALERAPQFMPALGAMVELDIKERKFEAALQRVKSWQDASAASADVSTLEAGIHIAQQKWPEAEAALHQALSIDPNNPRAYTALAYSYSASKRTTEALRQVESLLAKNPNNMRAVVLSAVIYGEQNEHGKARDAYEKFLAANPASTVVLNNLAYLYAEHLNDVDRAHELASKAREMEPASPLVADTLGWIHYRRKEYARALELISESAAKAPDNPEVQFHLAMANQQMGRTDAARAAFERAAAARNDFPGKSEIAKHLASLAQAGVPAK